MNRSEAFATETSGRELVAAEVRAELARRKLNSNSLPSIIGKSQRYWYERLNGKLSFSIDDLAALSNALQVPMSAFIPNVIAPTPDGDAPVDLATRRDNKRSRPLSESKQTEIGTVTDLFSRERVS